LEETRTDLVERQKKEAPPGADSLPRSEPEGQGRDGRKMGAERSRLRVGTRPGRHKVKAGGHDDGLGQQFSVEQLFGFLWRASCIPQSLLSY
jgi:hypothetical protein